MSTFATIFTRFSSVHLTKDVGMIPMEVSQCSGFDKSLLIYKDKGEDFYNPYEDNIILSPISASSVLSYYMKLFFFVLRRKVTHINIYHMNKETFIFILMFKVLSRKKVYLKLDFDNRGLAKLITDTKNNKIKWVIKRTMLSLVDLASIETNGGYIDLMKIWPNKKLLVVPNAVSPLTVSRSISPVKYNERDKVIIIVGRIGAFQKNHEMVVDALLQIRINNGWKIKFVGPISEEFKSKIYEIKKHPDADSIEFLGDQNREAVFNLYSKSRFFLMTSRYEGFSLAMTEAAYFGNVIISTPVNAVEELTSNKQYGIVIPHNDANALSRCIENIMADDSIYEQQYESRLSYVRNSFNLRLKVEEILHEI
ncbi:glycosyltransferase family 4 protein [Aeromonas veronii]